MGVVNVTPDSFSDGGRFLSAEAAIAQALRLVDEGADIVDLGAESSRPGSEPIPAEEEIRRLRQVLKGLAGRVTARISVDTTKAEVAAEALNLGATMVNDITAASDADMMEVVQKHCGALVLMHMRGTPRTMQQDTTYVDVVNEVRQFLSERVAAARHAGIREILVDPGIGFGKSVQQNVELLQRLGEFRSLGCPILVGPSRKSFLGAISGCRDAASRLPESLGAVCAAVMAGAEYVRVHDVAECRRALAIVDAVRGVQWTAS
jgi:dihydropteroate synthase